MGRIPLGKPASWWQFAFSTTRNPSRTQALMTASTLSHWILAYVTLLLLIVFLCSLYSEVRRRRFDPRPSDDRIFRCRDCAYVYTDDPTVDRARCPHCGCMNDPFSF
jgi:hypothetical protein